MNTRSAGNILLLIRGFLKRDVATYGTLTAFQCILLFFYLVGGKSQDEGMYLLLFISIMTYGIAWSLSSFASDDRMVHLLPVKESHWLIARPAFGFLMFGGIYLLALPLLGVIHPAIFMRGLQKLIIPGLTLTLFYICLSLVAYDASLAVYRKKAARFGLLAIAYVIPATIWLLYWPLWSETQKLLTWYGSLKPDMGFYTTLILLMLISALLILLDRFITRLHSWKRGLKITLGAHK